MNNDMSIVEQTYWYFREHPEITAFTTKEIYEALPHLSKHNLSAALYHLEQYGILTFIEKEGRYNVFQLNKNMLKEKHKPKFRAKPKFARRNKRTGYHQNKRAAIKSQEVKKRNLSNERLKELWDIKEELLELSARLEHLWDTCK
jgi:DNA-binding transcriptional regulator GbsR (MarR family)